MMEKRTLSPQEREQRRQLTNARQNAVRGAWKEEQQRVARGRGTRNWSPEEQKELLKSGRVKGYEGHHMKSVRDFPQYAGDEKCIQFLSEDEHLNGAHQGSYHNATNGYFNPETGVMEEFSGSQLQPVPEISLSQPYAQQAGENIDYMGSAGTSVPGVEEAQDYMGSAGVSQEGKETGVMEGEDNGEDIG